MIYCVANMVNQFPLIKPNKCFSISREIFRTSDGGTIALDWLMNSDGKIIWLWWWCNKLFWVIMVLIVGCNGSKKFTRIYISVWLYSFRNEPSSSWNQYRCCHSSCDSDSWLNKWFCFPCELFDLMKKFFNAFYIFSCQYVVTCISVY